VLKLFHDLELVTKHNRPPRGSRVTMQPSYEWMKSHVTLLCMDENLSITLFSVGENTYIHVRKKHAMGKRSLKGCAWVNAKCLVEDESEALEKPLDGRLRHLGWQIMSFS